MIATCTECGAPLIAVGVVWRKRDGAERPVEMQTLVGYSSPPGHNHDDNCLTRTYRCARGHDVGVSIRRRCSAPECAWVGKLSCSICCGGREKVDAWPEVAETFVEMEVP